MSAPFLLRVHGRGGHASMPGIADNALVKAAPLVELLGGYRAGAASSGPRSEAFLGRDPRTARRRRPRTRSRWRARSRPLAGELVEPLLGTTLAPTMAVASSRRNVIPSVCEITVDCRRAAGRRPGRACSTVVRAFLGDGDYELEPIERRGGTRSPIGGPLWDAVAGVRRRRRSRARGWRRSARPGSPTRTGCATAFGTVAYGFYPSRFDPETAARLIHSADERVPVDDLALGVRYLRHMARAICGP